MQDPRDPQSGDEAPADQSTPSDATPPPPDPVEPTPPDPVEPPPPPPVEPVAATTAASEPVVTASEPLRHLRRPRAGKHRQRPPVVRRA